MSLTRHLGFPTPLTTPNPAIPPNVFGAFENGGTVENGTLDVTGGLPSRFQIKLLFYGNRKSLFKVLDYILVMFKPDGEAHHSGVDACCDELLVG